MIFDVHSDALFGIIHYPEKNLLESWPKEYYGILNYYFKGTESYDSFLFILEKIRELKKDLPPLCLLGIEGLGPMKSIDDLEKLKNVGIRSLMLTWNDENKWATGALGNPQHGLTSAGKKLLKRMGEEGFILDLSHLNEKSFWDAIALFKGKVFASHSNCFSLSQHVRNLTDAQILAIAKRRGVIGINAYAPFVGGKENIDTYIDHLEHIRDLVGIQVPCFGFDFDDYLSDVPTTIKEVRSHQDIFKIILRMQERGWSKEEIDAVCYKNISRFLNL